MRHDTNYYPHDWQLLLGRGATAPYPHHHQPATLQHQCPGCVPLQHSPPIYIMRQVALMVPTVHRQHIGTTSTNIAQILTSRNKINIF